MSDSFSDWKRPKWDDYYMSIAVLVAQRSLDPSTKHGAVIVDENRRPLSFGYNGPPPECMDELIPLSRPEKYHYMEHAEANALTHCTVPTDGAIVYVTGFPCENCFRRMLCSRISRIIYGPIGSHMINEDTKKRIDIMNRRPLDVTSPNRGQAIRLSPYRGDIKSLIHRTLDYIDIKAEE